MIALIDYGAGNLRSVANALDAIRADYELVRTPDRLGAASKIILPGVGHFGQLARSLDGLGLREPVREYIARGTPFLGICLGMQALFETSAEAPGERGLGVLPGGVERFNAEARVPHMGWNTVEPAAGARLFRGIAGPVWLYFAHSYFAPLGDATSATCRYSVPYSAAVEQDNVFGVQFHPEKSAAAGQRILSNFVDL